MRLAVFDIDGTLTNTNDIDSVCFVRALAEAHGLEGINTSWGQYPHTTDSGILLHIFQERFGRAPAAEELGQFKRRFVNLLDQKYQSSAKRQRVKRDGA